MLQALHCKGVEQALSVPELNGAALSFSLSKIMLAVIFVICYLYSVEVCFLQTCSLWTFYHPEFFKVFPNFFFVSFSNVLFNFHEFM